MNNSKLFFLFLLFPFFAFTAHKFYISLIKVEYKAEEKTVQITMHVFIDDLQKVINKTYGTTIELGAKDEVKDTNVLISSYIEDNFKIEINSKINPYKYLGKEYENDIVYLYLELKNINKINSIQITDTMLMDYFPEQKNIVKLNINDIKKTLLLTKDKNKVKFTP
ncbi:DUF6702 family protein [Aureibaculum sp. 2210JD6-5]|uniref:DUF6702 family protein n=1 Tax=Aureibaculum sp. 2210JD6-5 TaxID=3103957 RepID=UPI002AAC846A|nr:DUF6702 family protein [Aureibaculum sp. 2210JD6-5]MDY7394005.1 DUF6702 family protein [Aureibaculum sp. 2210JD6-5]